MEQAVNTFSIIPIIISLCVLFLTVLINVAIISFTFGKLSTKVDGLEKSVTIQVSNMQLQISNGLIKKIESIADEQRHQGVTVARLEEAFSHRYDICRFHMSMVKDYRDQEEAMKNGPIA